MTHSEVKPTVVDSRFFFGCDCEQCATARAYWRAYIQEVLSESLSVVHLGDEDNQ